MSIGRGLGCASVFGCYIVLVSLNPPRLADMIFKVSVVVCERG